MPRSIASKLLYNVPQLFVIDGYGNFVCTNNQPLTEEGYLKEENGAVDIITVDLVRAIRVNLATQLKNFFDPTTQFLDRTLSQAASADVSQYSGGYNQSTETTGDNAIDALCFYKPIEEIPVASRTTVAGSGSLKWVKLPEMVYRSIVGRLYESGAWLTFDGKTSPLKQIVSNQTTTSLFYSTNKFTLLDDLVQGQDSVMVQGLNFYFDTTWEEEENGGAVAHNWKRLRYSDSSPTQTIDFISAKVINKDKFIFQLSGLSGYTGLKAGQQIYLSSGSFDVVELEKNYAIIQGYSITPNTVESPDGNFVPYIYGFAKLANGRIHAPTNLSPNIQNGMYGEYSLSSNDALAEVSTLTHMVSPAKAIWDKYGEMLEADPISVEKYWNKNEDPRVPQDRFGVVDSTDITDILNEDYVNYAWKGKLLDIDYVAILSYIFGYKDSFYDDVFTTTGQGYSNLTPWALNTLLFHTERRIALSIERSTGRVFWFAAGAVIEAGKMNADNLLISWIPRDIDGNKFHAYTYGVSNAIHDRDENRYGLLLNGLVVSEADYTRDSGGGKSGYSGFVYFKEGNDVYDKDQKVGSTVDEIDQKFGSYYAFNLFEYDGEYVGPSNKTLFSNVTTDKRYKGPLKCDGIYCIEPKGVTYQALLGNAYLGGAFPSSVSMANFANAPTEQEPNPTNEDAEGIISNIRPFNDLGAPLTGMYYVAWVHIYNYTVPEECSSPDCYYTDEGCRATFTIGGKSHSLSSISGSAQEASLYTLGYFAGFIQSEAEELDCKLSINTPQDGQNACYVYVQAVAVYADNTAVFPSAGATFEQQTTGGVDAETATENARVAFNWHDRHSYATPLPMEANSTYAVQSEIHSIDDACAANFIFQTKAPTQLVFPLKVDKEVFWLGPNVANFCDLFTRLCSLSDGFYGTVRDPQWATFLAGDCPFFVPIKPGNTQKFFHLGGDIKTIVSLRETFGGKPLFTITNNGDDFSVKAPADQKGYDFLIVYDTYNEVPGFIPVMVCSYNFAVFPDLQDNVTEIRYFMNSDRKSALSAKCSPLIVTKRIAFATYHPQVSSAAGVTSPGGTEDYVAHRELLKAASGAQQGRYSNDDNEEGTFDVEYDYLDEGRTNFKLTGVKLRLSKTKLNITDNRGDSLTVTNSQNVPFEPRLCEYLVDTSDTSKTYQIACDVKFTDDLWTSNASKTSWTLTFPPGYNPPANNGFIYRFCIMGLLDGEFIQAFTDPFQIEKERTSSGSGNAYDPNNPPTGGTNTFPNATTTSQTGWPNPSEIEGQENYFYYSSTPFNVGQFGMRISWPDPVIT